ncbi:MAG: histidinol-phosphate transaminase [Pyrinomonadaceae bacterium]|nr:histidinol-phosphate transaminase [Pyrinomonadaceae bacterium]
MTFDLSAIVRDNIKNLTAYSSARKEFNGTNAVFLDANENSFGSPIETDYSRYPDPLQLEIKRIIADWNGVLPQQIFIGNGSDEAIDLLIRAFCEPKIDQIIITPPTYGMYEVSANINDVNVKSVLLDEDFQLSPDKVLENVGDSTKIIFLCSPNNPTGNSLQRNSILKVIENFKGIVVIDEAYIHFSDKHSFINDLQHFQNLVVMQTFSKAWGLAGLRVGIAFASVEIIELLNKIKPPYNVSQIAQEALLKALKNRESVKKVVSEIVEQRNLLRSNLLELPIVSDVYPSDANFLLVKTIAANRIYSFLVDEKIIVRNRSNVELCENCLRITVGTESENQSLITALKAFR